MLYLVAFIFELSINIPHATSTTKHIFKFVWNIIDNANSKEQKQNIFFTTGDVRLINSYVILSVFDLNDTFYIFYFKFFVRKLPLLWSDLNLVSQVGTLEYLDITDVNKYF